MRHFRASLRSHGVTEQQWRVLRALSSVGEIEIADLVRSTFLLAPSLSRILRDLEQRKLIARHLLKSDLRRNIVSITAKGLKLIEVVAPSSEAIYGEMTRRFGARKLAELQAMLHELEICLQAMPAEDGDDADAPPDNSPA